MPTHSFSFASKIALLTGFAVSFPDSKSPDRNKNLLLLPRLCGQPYIPSSSIRGKLRHIATHMVMDRLGDIKLNLADINWLAVGGIKEKKGKEDDNSKTANMMLQRPAMMSHLWSFWGFADPIFVGSKMQIENARAADRIEVDIIQGQRLDMIQRGEISPDQVADPDSFDAWIERIAAHKAGKKAKVARRNGEEDVPEVDEVVAANMPFSREIIPPKNQLETYISIYHATTEQLGLFVATMRAFSANPVFGAQVGMNLGLVDLRMDAADEWIEVEGRSRSFNASPALLEAEAVFVNNFTESKFRMPTLNNTK